MTVQQHTIRGIQELGILKLVSERAMYGYELIRVARDRTAGAFEWEEGTVYPCLHRLEAEGLIRSQWHLADNGRRRKYYYVAGKGAARLHQQTIAWRGFCAAANAILAEDAG